MPAGKIIWSYVKPLLRGQILYAPNTTVISEVMAIANETFAQIEHFSVLMNSFEKTFKSLASLTEMSDTLRELQSILSSDVMKVAIKTMGGGNFEGTKIKIFPTKPKSTIRKLIEFNKIETNIKTQTLIHFNSYFCRR